MESSLLELVGIGKKFGFRQVLRNVNLILNKGDFILLLGNNGAGKSTMMRILCLLMNPSTGEILYRNIPLKEQKSIWLKQAGALSHESRFYSDLTARENLKIYGTLYGKKNLDLRIEEVLNESNLIHASNLPVRNFSSGMSKRLMISRLILLQPQFLILDEPFTGLDQKSLDWFKNYLKKFHQNGGTVMLVTHQLELGLELAQRVLFLHRQTILHDLKADSISVDQCKAILED
jgi:heme exporter protein A